jgi:general stress protein 26
MRKIVNARPDFDPMTEAEVDSFLESKLNVQQLLATVDQTGDPNIQPFSLSLILLRQGRQKKLYVTTGKTTKKVQNIRNKPTVYFSRIL